MVDMELAQKLCDYLNSLVALDPNAIAVLISNRTVCNQALADHPTVQVWEQNGGFNVTMLGVLNGLAGMHEDGPNKGFGGIAAYFDVDEKKPVKSLIGFHVVPADVPLSRVKMDDQTNSAASAT